MGLLRFPARADRVVAVFATKSNHKGAAQLGPPHSPRRTPTRSFARPSSHSRHNRTPVFSLARRFLPPAASPHSRAKRPWSRRFFRKTLQPPFCCFVFHSGGWRVFRLGNGFFVSRRSYRYLGTYRYTGEIGQRRVVGLSLAPLSRFI